MRFLKPILFLLRSTAFLLVVCATLATTTLSLGIAAVSMSAQVATLTAGAAVAATTQARAVATAVAKAKAKEKTKEKTKARLKRVLVAVPVAGLAAAAAFEYADYLEWQQVHPEGTAAEYGCEVAALSAEVIDEVLQDLPEATRPPRDLVLSQLPACPTSATAVEMNG